MRPMHNAQDYPLNTPQPQKLSYSLALKETQQNRRLRNYQHYLN